MNFKNYPREYELVFSDFERVGKKCNIDYVSFHNDRMSPVRYQMLYLEEANKYKKDIFDHIVKIHWLNRNFCYRNMHRKKIGRNGSCLDTAFGLFTRVYGNVDMRFLFPSHSTFGKVVTYFDDFFPNFEEGNPFEEKYEYPYKYMGMECLVVVYQMDERLDLLKHGEKMKMSYVEFLDYIYNYVRCYTDEHGKKYDFILSHVFMPYVKKYEEA